MLFKKPKYSQNGLGSHFYQISTVESRRTVSFGFKSETQLVLIISYVQ